MVIGRACGRGASVVAIRAKVELLQIETRMRDYLVIYEQGKDGSWGAYAPDLPGLGVAAETREEVEQLIREGIGIHINALREDGQPIPEPKTFAQLIATAA